MYELYCTKFHYNLGHMYYYTLSLLKVIPENKKIIIFFLLERDAMFGPSRRKEDEKKSWAEQKENPARSSPSWKMYELVLHWASWQDWLIQGGYWEVLRSSHNRWERYFSFLLTKGCMFECPCHLECFKLYFISLFLLCLNLRVPQRMHKNDLIMQLF